VASATATLSGSTGTFDAALKDFYEGMIRTILNRLCRVYAWAKMGSKTVSGRRVVFPVNVRGNPGSAPIRAGANLPVPTPQTLVESSIYMQEWWSRIQVNSDLIDQARDDRGAFERPVAFEIRRMTEDVVEWLNIMGFGTGTGVIAEVDSLAGQDITLKDLADSGAETDIFSKQGNRYIKIGSRIDVGTAYTTTPRQQGLVVTAKNVGTNTITVTGTTTGIAAGDAVYIANPTAGTLLRDTSPMGLGGIIDDGTFVNGLQNINRTTYPIWAANALAPNGASFSSPGALTLDLLQAMVDMAAVGGPGFPSVALMEHATRREYLKLVQTDRRYMEKFKYEPGIQESHLKEWPWETTLAFDGFPFALDRHCPWRTIFAPDARAVRKWVWRDWHWKTHGQNGGTTMYLLPGIAGTYEAQGNIIYSLGTDDAGPAGSSVVRHIQVPLTNGNPTYRVDKE